MPTIQQGTVAEQENRPGIASKKRKTQRENMVNSQNNSKKEKNIFRVVEK